MIAWMLYPDGDVDEVDIDPIDLGLLLLPDDEIVRFIGLCDRLTDDRRCTKNDPSLNDDDVTR